MSAQERSEVWEPWVLCASSDLSLHQKMDERSRAGIVRYWSTWKPGQTVFVCSAQL